MAKPRENFKDDLKWNVKDLFKTEKDYEQTFSDLEIKLEEFKKYENRILESSDTLYELLEFDNEFNKKLEQVFVYAHIQNDQDTTNTKFQTMYGKAYLLYEKYNEKTAFIVPEILKKDYSLIDSYIKENTKLKPYERVLKDIFKFKEHTLSENEEKLLSSLASVFSTPDDVFGYLINSDLKFGDITNELGEKEELNERSYRKFIESKDPKVRKEAFLTLLNTYGSFKNTLAVTLSKEVAKNNRIASIRKYKSALNAALDRNDIPEEIYSNLIKTVRKNVQPLSEFWKLKKEVLGLDELHLYDANAPLVKEVKHNYTEKEAHDLLMEALGVLGDDYLANLDRAFKEKWIDFAPNDGKRTGAYCTACYNVHPYVLLSFDGSLDNVSTLAHELGHAMHYYYAINNQTYQDYSYSIFVAEVASQVNQILLSKYLINKTNDINEKKYLLDDLIRDFKATIYRQTMFAEFEKIIHEKEQAGEILTHEVMSNIFYDLNVAYFGDNIIVDDVVKYEWARIPHFYYNFYVYQYATAYAAAIKIATDILNKKENAVHNYIEFLKLGCTKTPIESLNVAGVFMDKEETLNEAFAYFNDLVLELKSLYDKK